MSDILIVEDDADLATTIGALLESYGHTVRIAFNGEEGLHALDERLPDLILLDIEMPVIDGPAMAYEAMVQNAGKQLVPIIVSSGYADLDAIADRIGTPYRIAKPCSLPRLTSLVERATSERRPPHPAQKPGARLQ
ncbi:MAG: response regulator [Labilithrix sp.]|nr:response regulator [Labilithrix sp.]